MASTLGKPPSQQHRLSRSNSISPSSIITVQRAASLTSRNGTHPPVSGLRSQSPNESNSNPPNLSVRTLSPDSKRRASAIYTRPDSGTGVREGVGNLNRWSQSTVSSKSSSTHNRGSSFTRRLSGSFSSFSGFTAPQASPPNGKFVTKAYPSPKNSPQKLPKQSSRNPPPPSLPPIVTLSSLSQAVDAADSPSTVATATPATAELLSPSTYSSNEPDYFGGRWKARSPVKSPQKPNAAVQRTATAISPLASTSPPRRVAQVGSPETRRQPTTTSHATALYSKHNPSRGSHSDRYRGSRSGHSRNRGSGRGSGGTEEESSGSSVRSSRDKAQRRKTPSQKAMLSKALQKANHAVLLDNAQNFEGAMTAYGDACALLQQVMVRSSGPDDRRKLEAVRNTYTNRIIELRNTDLSYQNADGKALPDRPRDRYSADQELFLPITGDDEHDDEPATGLATSRHDGRPSVPAQRSSPSLPRSQIPPRRQSLRPSAFGEVNKLAQKPSRVQSQHSQPLWAESKPSGHNSEPSVNLEPPVFRQYLPPPLSPRRPLSPAPLTTKTMEKPAEPAVPSGPGYEPGQPHHARQDTTESTSWLDTIDESGRSSSSSVHSRTSSVGVRRKRIRAASGATEAEFDAALDAAVEAAYDDGFELMSEKDEEEQLMLDPKYLMGDHECVSDARRNVEMAKERVREAEREAAIAAVKEREKRRLEDGLATRDSIDTDYCDDEAEEEERMLEEMTKDYIMDDSEYDLQSKSALPRQSDSSGFSGRTWASSLGSNPTTAGTSLSTVAEAPGLPSMATQLQSKTLPPPSFPPPSVALPAPPQNSVNSPTMQLSNISVSRPTSLRSSSTPGVRDRRLSGREVKQLKIETDSRLLPTSILAGPKTQPSSMPSPLSPREALTEPPKSASATTDSQEILPRLAFQPSLTTQTDTIKDSSPLPGPSLADLTPITIPTTQALSKVTSADSEDSVVSMPDSPVRFTRPTTSSGNLRKNFSSSSLKKMLSAPGLDSSLESSSKAPTAGASSSTKQRRIPPVAVPSLPTPIGPNFTIDGLQTGGIHLFESEIHSPHGPGTPNPLATNAPLPLEPCPESSLLRPFWFLRCIYQTIAHPRGGYISNRLFVPRDIWLVKNVKLKNVEEKMSTCDFLTSALLKLAKVDTLDAGAVLEEMQFFESVIDQAQMSLSKKLGSEVGLLGVSWLSKGSNTAEDTMSNAETLTSKSGNTGSKYGLSSWRKLRSKTSTGPGFNPATVATVFKDGVKEPPTMSSLPMTSLSNPRIPKRDVSQVKCAGPNANYMGALARLCDAVQILDQIARQVEDPGLKHTSPTHVGLELSARRAADFFGFYISRFVMTDVGMMLDKFIKRGSEWVLS